MPDRIKRIFDILHHEIPNAAIELEYEDPYCLLVSVVLSAQSTDLQVNRATKGLFPVANSPAKMVELGYEGLCNYVNSVGLYKTKAKNIIKLSQILIDKHGGRVPETKEKLMALPGVGLKSANVILNVLHHLPTMPVDTHVFRVATRLDISHAKTRDSMSIQLEKVLPKHLDSQMLVLAHHLLVLHGRYTCKAINPKCTQCPLKNLCKFQYVKPTKIPSKTEDTIENPVLATD